MAAEQVMDAPVELRMTADDWSRLHSHLFPGDHDEHAAVLLCGIAASTRSCRLLVREVALAQDGTSYVPGTQGYRHLTGEFVTHLIRRARDEKLVYLAVHNHGGTDKVSFSRTDLQSHERGYPTLLGLTQAPVGALVVAEGAIAGDIWLPGGSRRPLTRTVIAGGSPAVLTPAPDQGDATVHARYSRQSLLYGHKGQQILGQAKVAVVGAGGVGMLLVQALARLGVGHLVVIDPDRVDPTNLPRLPETTRLDAMAWFDQEGRPIVVRSLARKLAHHKVRVARRIARRANNVVHIEDVVGDVADDKTARLITDCDFIFLAADTMLARDIVNQIAFQYLIPTLQVGSKVVSDPGTGEIRDIFSVVRTLGTQRGCLRCNDLIDLRRLGEESLGDPDQVQNQRYLDEPEIHAPSVITLNAIGTGWAANKFMLYMVGLQELAIGFQVLRTTPVVASHPHVVLQEPDINPDCHVCGRNTYSALGRGDQHDLPTRLR
jgi:molybdopterin/thiamine biosynthesis adenylyltransferase